MKLNDSDAIYLGAQTVDAVYVGATKVWPASSGFAPTDIDDCVMWLDAAQITGLADGDAVDTWYDSSGNSANASKGAFNAPTYRLNQRNGLPVVRFVASSNQALRGFFTNTPGYTLFAVGHLTGGSNGRLVGAIISLYRNHLTGWWNGYENVMYAEGWVSPGTVLATTDWRCYMSGNAGGIRTYFRKNGSPYADGTGGQANMNGSLALSGQNMSSPGEMSNGELGEVIIFGRLLDGDEIDQVESYLLAKWDI